jgi:anion-transporting  ArsA/GET3 family ATPase
VRASATAAGLCLDVEDAAWLLTARNEAGRRRRAAVREIGRLRGTAPLLELSEADEPGVDPVRALAALMAPPQATEAPEAAESPVALKPVKGPYRSSWAAARETAGTAQPTLQGSLAERRIIVVCGSGGVGKTTISAAIAIHAAEEGRRTALLTVDPARRLATALRLPPTAGERATIRVARGRHVEATQLDTRRTFDELVERFAPDAAQRERILRNPYYRRLADTLGGTHEYMAMEKLHRLAEQEEHDAIVIDTPPTRSAMSFLDAPKRLTDFLRGRFIRIMVRPAATAGRLTISAARLGARAMLRTVGRLVGAETLADAVEFLAAFEGLYGGFAERASRVMDLLASDECAFVIVASPSEGSLAEADAFVERLTGGGMHPAAVVLNRFTAAGPPAGIQSLAQDPGATARMEAGGPPDRASAAVVRLGIRAETARRAGLAAIEGFASRHPDVPIVTVPDLGPDVHDVAGLRRVAGRLFMPNP